jgi:hypothetical protein
MFMKKFIAFTFLVFAVLFNLTAQSYRGQSMNGSTGLFFIPTGHVGWEDGNTHIGFDFGYRAVINNDAGVSHIPAATISFFKYVEISTAFDIQPDSWYGKNTDLLFGIKFRLPTKNTAVAIGLSVQLLNLGNNNYDYYAYQPYIVFTYPGTFFNMKTETTFVIGKTFYSGGPDNNSNIDIGMGFDITFFPDAMGSFLHGIIDFANFSYSDNAWPNDSPRHSGPSWWRGVLNLGLRFDLSSIPALKNFKFVIDAVCNDLFDAGQRSFTVGAVFGFRL